MTRRNTVLWVLAVLGVGLVGSVAIRFLAARREELETVVRVDGLTDLGEGRYLVRPQPAPGPSQEVEVAAITRYPFGFAVIEPKEGHDPLRPAARPTAVRTAQVAPETRARHVLAYGRLAAVGDARVAAEVGGRVLGFAAPLGATVAEGDPLLELDPTDAQLRLETSRVEVAVAEGRRGQAAANLAGLRDQLAAAEERLAARARERDRWQRLVGDSVASQDRADQADEVWRLARAAYVQLEAAAETAAADLVAAEASLVRAQVAERVATRDRARCTVRAPFAGEVVDRLVGVGDTVAPGTAVVRLVDASRVRVRLHVRPGEATWLSAGAGAQVEVPSLLPPADAEHPRFTGRRGLVTTGTIEGVSAAADPATQKVAVDVVLENPGALRPGLFARVTLDGGEVEGAVWIPDTAVVADEERATLYVVVDDRVQRHPVELGARLGEGRLLRSSPEAWGSPPWEVVVDGTALLFDGAPIRRLE
ncbi:MAG: efflux RND transporter periplasmic adaptor subunit [Planctomycetota bacterium]